MTKRYVRVGGRGTSRRVVSEDEDSGNWTGAPFKQMMEKRKEESKDRYITVGRGTGTIKFGDIAKTPGRPSGKGMWVGTGRGTGKRKIE